MNNNNPTSETNPSGLGSLDKQEGTKTKEKHMSSTATGGEGGFDEADTGKDWRFDPFGPSNDLIASDDHGGVGTRPVGGELGIGSQERDNVAVKAIDVPLAALPALSSLSSLGIRGKGEHQVRELSEKNCYK